MLPERKWHIAVNHFTGEEVRIWDESHETWARKVAAFTQFPVIAEQWHLTDDMAARRFERIWITL